MRDLNKSIGRERAVYSTDGELKMLGEGAQQKRRQLSETSALGKIRLQWSCAGPHTVIFVFFFFFLVNFAANQLHIEILIPSLWQNLKA